MRTTHGTSSDARSPIRPHRAWSVALVAGLLITGAAAFATMPGLLTESLQSEYRWSRASIGLAASVNMVVYGLVAPFAAAWMDRFGLRRVALVALLLVAVGAALTTLMSQAWQFTLYWGLLVGAGTGSLSMTFAATVAQRWFVERRGLVVGALTAVVLAVLAAAVLRAHPADVGLRPYGATSAVVRPAPRRGATARTLRVLSASVRDRRFWLLAATFAVCGAATDGLLWTHFVPAARDQGMAVTMAATLVSAVGVFSLVGTVVSGWSSDRFDPRWLLASYYAGRAVLLASLPLALGPQTGPMMVAFVVLFGLLGVATVPPTILLARRMFGADGAVVFGWVNAVHQMGAGTMAVTGGLVRDVGGGYGPVWLLAAALCVLAASASLRLGRAEP